MIFVELKNFKLIEIKLILFFSFFAGCFSDRKGVSPQRNEFSFPTAALITPDQKYLLVANSNFDLAWESGTVVVIDLEKVESIVSGCPEEGCQPLEETSDFILEDETVLIGSYASFMSLAPGGKRIYITIRGNNSLTTINLNEDGESGRKIYCFKEGDTSRRCDSNHVVTYGTTSLPPDPHALNSELDGWVFVSSLSTNGVTVFKVDTENDIERDLPPKLLYVDNSFPTGVSWIKKHPKVGLFYATSRTVSDVITFRFVWDNVDYENSPRFYFGYPIKMSVLSSGNDARAIDFTEDGNFAFVTNRSPNSLVIVDTSIGPNGWPANNVIGVVGLDQGPSMVKVWQPPGDDRTFVYATCYNADRVYVIDPFTRAKLDTIATGDGPHVFVTDSLREMGYLVNFIESTISVIDINPESPMFNKVRATLGKPKRVNAGN